VGRDWPGGGGSAWPRTGPGPGRRPRCRPAGPGHRSRFGHRVDVSDGCGRWRGRAAVGAARQLLEQRGDFSLDLDHEPGVRQLPRQPLVLFLQPGVLPLNRVRRRPPARRGQTGQRARVPGLAPLRHMTGVQAVPAQAPRPSHQARPRRTRPGPPTCTQRETSPAGPAPGPAGPSRRSPGQGCASRPVIIMSTVILEDLLPAPMVSTCSRAGASTQVGREGRTAGRVSASDAPTPPGGPPRDQAATPNGLSTTCLIGTSRHRRRATRHWVQWPFGWTTYWSPSTATCAA
jgi:hypothetical protein